MPKKRDTAIDFSDLLSAMRETHGEEQERFDPLQTLEFRFDAFHSARGPRHLPILQFYLASRHAADGETLEVLPEDLFPVC